MPSRLARKLFDETEGAARKHQEKIASLDAGKPAIDWESYSRVIKGESDIVHDLKAKYNHISIPYPNDVENRMGAAEAKDVEIKEVRDLILSQVSDRTMDNEKDRAFFYRLPEARCMTEEMYMEAFPQRERVQPRDREQFEDEITDVKHKLAEFAQKRDERKKYL